MGCVEPICQPATPATAPPTLCSQPHASANLSALARRRAPGRKSASQPRHASLLPLNTTGTLFAQVPNLLPGWPPRARLSVRGAVQLECWFMRTGSKGMGTESRNPSPWRTSHPLTFAAACLASTSFARASAVRVWGSSKRPRPLVQARPDACARNPASPAAGPCRGARPAAAPLRAPQRRDGGVCARGPRDPAPAKGGAWRKHGYGAA